MASSNGSFLPPDQFVSIAKACEELAISETTRWRWDKAGRLPTTIRIGGKVGYSRRQLDRWKAARGFEVEAA